MPVQVWAPPLVQSFRGILSAPALQMVNFFDKNIIAVFYNIYIKFIKYSY